jgi:nucleoside-diphosphate-sugar epimerase
MKPGKVLITGAFGKVGTALANLEREKVLLDRAVPSDYSGTDAVKAEIQDRDALRSALRGCSAIVHLAGSAAVESSWDEVVENNIVGMQILMETAKEAQVERVIFASTNHVVGMVEKLNAPRIYEEGHDIMLTKEAAPQPDSLYGVSKLFGENLGRYVAENGGPRFYAVRIGAVRGEQEDHPYADAEAAVRSGACRRGDAAYELSVRRQKALWLSRRDLVQLIERCLDYDGPAFDIFYGVSDNPTRWLDIEYARQQLGYRPQDSSAHWAAAPLEQAAA